LSHPSPMYCLQNVAIQNSKAIVPHVRPKPNTEQSALASFQTTHEPAKTKPSQPKKKSLTEPHSNQPSQLPAARVALPFLYYVNQHGATKQSPLGRKPDAHTRRPRDGPVSPAAAGFASKARFRSAGGGRYAVDVSRSSRNFEDRFDFCVTACGASISSRHRTVARSLRRGAAEYACAPTKARASSRLCRRSCE